MRVDFYQLTRDPAEAVVPRLAEQTLKRGERLLVVSADAAQLDMLSKALWEHSPDSFLAHGRAGGAHDARQPILLSDGLEPANGARFCALADGRWRDGVGERFARVFLLFGPETLAEARACWRRLGQAGAAERRFWKQDGQRWVEGP